MLHLDVHWFEVMAGTPWVLYKSKSTGLQVPTVVRMTKEIRKDMNVQEDAVKLFIADDGRLYLS